MPNLAQLAPSTGRPLAAGVPGTVTLAPLDADDALTVQWGDDNDPDHEQTARWFSNGRLAAEGDDALILFDTQADPWVLVKATGAAL